MNDLPGSSARMGLAGEDDLHRPLRVVEDALEPLRVAEEQGGALVGRKAPCEADGQCVRVEFAAAALTSAGAAPCAAVGRGAPRAPGRASPASRRVLGPGALSGMSRTPRQVACSSIAPRQCASRCWSSRRETGIHPRRCGRRWSRGRSAPPPRAGRATATTCAGRLAVQLADAVGEAHGAQRQHRHAELGAPRVIVAAEARGTARGPAPAGPSSGRRSDPSGRSRTHVAAGTGVWVVKSALALAAHSAASNGSPSSWTSSRMRSSCRKAACPSFRCQTVGR